MWRYNYKFIQRIFIIGSNYFIYKIYMSMGCNYYRFIQEFIGGCFILQNIMVCDVIIINLFKEIYYR